MPLDFANEQWVRIYRRDTVTIKLLSWDARSLLWALLRKADRAGVIDVGDNGTDGIAVLIDAPVAVVERGLPELLSRGVLRGGDGCYVFPRFLEAQETPASDAARQRESRAKRRDIAIAGIETAENGSLYIARAGSGEVKIGFATDVQSRLRNIATSRPDGVTLVAIWAGTRADEAAMHLRFASLRIAGEWFRYEGELVAFCESVTGRDSSVTGRIDTVTSGHAASRAVTLRREETIREEYSQLADFAAVAAEKSAEPAEQSPEPKAGRGSRRSLKTAQRGLSLPFAQPDSAQEKTAATAQTDASGEVSQNATVTAKWFDRFERHTGAKPTWGKEAGAQMKRLLGIHSAEELCRRIDNAFEAPPYPHTPPADFLSFVRGVDKYATRHGGAQVKPIQQQPRPYRLEPRIYGGDK